MNAELFRTVNGRYGQIAYFSNDVGAIGRSLALYGEWAENEIAFLRHCLVEGAVVLDVGAYIGTHTLALSRTVGSEGKIIAFEPQPAAFELLKLNVDTNRLNNVLLNNTLVSERSEVLAIPTIDVEHDGSFGSASFSDQLHSEDRALQKSKKSDPQMVKVRSITIDELDLPQCDLIKIDAEGTEDLVIRGAAQTIKRLRPTIYAECNSVTDGLRTVELLRSFGYAIRLHLVNAFSADNFFDQSENIFAEGREAAIIGLPPERLEALDLYHRRLGDLILRIDTADDLVLGLLNKPQYPDEILRPSAAAADGAALWLDNVVKLKLDAEAFERHAITANQILADERVEFEKRLFANAKRAQEREEHLMSVLADSRAASEAAMLQARLARMAADSAEAARHAESQRFEAAQREFDRQVNDLKSEKAQLGLRLDAIYRSTSWRITVPLRKLVMLLRGK